MNPTVRKILDKYKIIRAMEYGQALIGWDESTYMPPGAAKERGEISAVLSSFTQKYMLHPDFVRLVENASKESNLSGEEKAIVRILQRDIKQYKAIPPKLLEDLQKLKSVAHAAWVKAKKQSNFSLFEPHLEKMVELKRKVAEKLGYQYHPYDALLDLFEEDLDTKTADSFFNGLKPLSKLNKQISTDKLHPFESVEYNETNVRTLNTFLISRLGFDFNVGRMDVAAHPFTEGVGKFDVRITTWYPKRNFRMSVLAAVHECGHALYELNLPYKLFWTPVYGGASFGIHETSSRFWENIIGKSFEFVSKYFDVFSSLIPEIAQHGPNMLYSYFLLPKHSLIRVEANEIEYPLHILLRYEIERDLIGGELSVSELPEVWNEKMESYIGLIPENDSQGVLQDVHWSHGYFGYFPSYAIGTVFAAQVKAHFESAHGSIEQYIQNGDFKTILNFLKDKIYKYGKLYKPMDLIKHSFGENLDPKYFLEHVQKYKGVSW